jgi:hypothetical protein
MAPTDPPNESESPHDGGPVVFTPGEISAKSAECADDTARCAQITVRTIATSGGDSEAVRDNIGVVADGLLIHWDPYAIAPYSMGPIDVLIPAAQLDGLVDRSY